ncbi:hypothetical protein FS749_010411 [Ceratobasidium sp. UAMH 11750]|nr:hypothetical protein FS749_010411 [Ceratobasidium sp. UAMH 11750]
MRIAQSTNPVQQIEYCKVLAAPESAVRWETASYPFRIQMYNGGALVEEGCEHDGSLIFLARACLLG